jgi:Flp pilus assembly protein TadD
MRLCVILMAVLAAASAGPTSDPQPTAERAREARAAYDKGDKATFLAKYEEIAKRRPGDVYVLYNLACGQALNGRTAEAERTLLQIATRTPTSTRSAGPTGTRRPRRR